jgi:acetylglutamate kinase
MTMSKLTHHTDHKIVIKLGGSTLEQLSEKFFQNFHSFLQKGYKIIITHGGGPAINAQLKKQQIESSTINGLRVTTDDMINIVQQTLIGEVNPKLVAQLNAAGIPAIGLNGFDHQLLKGNYLDQQVYGHVGEVTSVNNELIEVLINAGYVPVIACIGSTDEGAPLNVNGDTVACSVAKSVQATSLLLVTDVAGIRINGEFQQEVSQANIDEWIKQGEIYGGMIPKVQGAITCLQAGIPSVQIVNETLTGTTILSEELVK